MKRAFAMLAVAGLVAVTGCEEKKAPATAPVKSATDAVKAAGDKAAGAVKDAGKAAADTAKDAAKATTDAAKDAAAKTTDAAKAGMDKAKDAAAGAVDAAKDKAVAGLKTMVDSAKTKIEALTKGGASVPADKKADFTKALTGINEQFATLTKGFDGLKSLSGEGLMTKVKELTGTGDGLMKTVTDTAAKFGIKL